jgi:hypothetical protein
MAVRACKSTPEKCISNFILQFGSSLKSMGKHWRRFDEVRILGEAFRPKTACRG